MTTADAQFLYEYNQWANTRLLMAATLLTNELLMKELGGSYPSIFGTLGHIAWGEWLWLARWQERRATGVDPLRCSDLAALRSRWNEIQGDQAQFVSRLTPADLERLISYENPSGTRWTYPLRHMLQHVVSHSTYHRGQVAGMLRQVGVTPPATDFLVYFDDLADRTFERIGP